MKPKAVHTSGIYLTAKETPETSARRLSDDHATTHRLKWGALPPNKVGRIAQNITEGEGRKLWRRDPRDKSRKQKS